MRSTDFSYDEVRFEFELTADSSIFPAFVFPDQRSIFFDPLPLILTSSNASDEYDSSIGFSFDGSADFDYDNELEFALSSISALSLA